MMFIDIHTHNIAEQEDVIRVANLFPGEDLPGHIKNVFFSTGLHPWYIDESDIDQSMELLRNSLQNDRIVAVGESGLDKLKGPGIAIQKRVFLKQTELSEEFRKPLIIHCVKMYNEILTMRKTTGAKQPWILHGFSSSVQMMKQMTDNGIFVSLGPAILKDSKKTESIVKEAPLEFLFVETDTGEAGIKDIYKTVAEIRGMRIDMLKENIFNNFQKIFGNG